MASKKRKRKKSNGHSESSALARYVPPSEPPPPTPEEVEGEVVSAKRKHRTQERYLPVKLTQSELRDKSRALAQTVDDIAAVEARKKVANDGFKRELDGLKGVQNTLAHMVDTGEESRPVKCTWHGDWAQKLMRLYRDDTSALIETRPMSESELQVEIEDWGDSTSP